MAGMILKRSAGDVITEKAMERAKGHAGLRQQMEGNPELRERLVQSMKGPISVMNTAFMNGTLKDKQFAILHDPTLERITSLKNQLQDIDPILFQKSQEPNFKYHAKNLKDLTGLKDWQERYFLVDTPYFKVIVNPKFFQDPDELHNVGANSEMFNEVVTKKSPV